MPSPFPGMDPYLEHPATWPNVHVSLITTLRNRLIARLRPRYWVAVEERVYDVLPDDLLLIGVPDAAVVRSSPSAPARSFGTATLSRSITVEVPVPETVREHYLEVREPRSGEVVTVIEILSPANKHPGPGRQAYLKKRDEVLKSRVNLVEVDLLRTGERMPMRVSEVFTYGVLVHAGRFGGDSVLFPASLREPLPRIGIPLLSAEELVDVDLGNLVNDVYEAGGWEMALDYRRSPQPPLSPEDELWADALLREKGLR